MTAKYNDIFKMRDLFMNPKLAGVFPQFERGVRLQNVYSFAQVERRILEYLKNVFNGSVTDEGELIVRGKKIDVLRRVTQLQGAIEVFFNNMPSIVKNLRSNTKLYLPYATLSQIEGLNTAYKKYGAMREVLENVNYNPNFSSQNGIQSPSALPYQKRQDAWKKKVGFKE
jgi:hypothetical protein